MKKSNYFSMFTDNILFVFRSSALSGLNIKQVILLHSLCTLNNTIKTSHKMYHAFSMCLLYICFNNLYLIVDQELT